MISKLHFITQDLPSISHPKQAERACAAGIDWIQLRTKNKTEKEWYDIAVRTQEVCIKYGAKLIINDNPNLAYQVLADGVHVGKNDMSLSATKEILGENFIIGCTTNDVNDVIACKDADYVGLGPFQFTTTKDNLSPILGLEGYKLIVDSINNVSTIPIIAIGGIKIVDVKSILQTGVYGIAISSGINLAASPEKAIELYLKELN